MASSDKEEKVLAEFHGIRHKKRDGVLLLTSMRVAWTPGEIVHTFEANYLYQEIKAQRVSPDGSSRVQLQLVLHSGLQVNFHFTETNAMEQRQQAKNLLSQLLVPKQRISAELEAKNKLLKNNQQLYQLYKDLVTTSIISADEFWANQMLLAQDTNIHNSSQEGGLPSAFLADVQAVYDGCNAVCYNLSSDAMLAIFKTYPSVKKRHAECVPDKLREEEFWTQFFESQLLHQNECGGTFMTGMTDDLVISSSSSSGINDMETSSTILGEEGYGSSSSFCMGGTTPSSLLHRCNHHSNRVLAVLQSSPTTLCATPTSPLTSHQHLPFLSQTSTSTTIAHSSLLPQAQSLVSWQLQHEFSSTCAYSAMSHLAPESSLMTSGCGQKGSSLLTEEEQQQVLRHQAAIAELLRHFWSCFPARTPQLEAKVHRIHQSLLEYRTGPLQELEIVLGNSDDSLHAVQHLCSCLAKASQHYTKWMNKKKTSK